MHGAAAGPNRRTSRPLCSFQPSIALSFARGRKKERKKEEEERVRDLPPRTMASIVYLEIAAGNIESSLEIVVDAPVQESGAVGSSGVIVFPSSPPSPCPYPVHVSTRHSAQEVQTIDSFSLSSRLSPCIARSPRYSARDSFEDRDPSVCAERSRESRL